MPTIAEIRSFMERIAPPRLAESWDNVGLLLGDPRPSVDGVMTCLTVTPESAAEAITGGAGLIITHHPMPFSAVKQITTETHTGKLLVELLGARVAVYSAHTAWDSAERGINQLLAEGLNLHSIQPLLPHPSGQGTGRYGWLEDPLSLSDLAIRLKSLLQIKSLQIVGDAAVLVRTVGVACGAAGELLPTALAVGCDVFVVGETRFHTCLEAQSEGMGLLLPGHFASERFSMDILAEQLAAEFPSLNVWASRAERDPLVWF